MAGVTWRYRDAPEELLVRFEVTDTGVGIAPEKIAQLMHGDFMQVNPAADTAKGAVDRQADRQAPRGRGRSLQPARRGQHLLVYGQAAAR